MCLKHKGLTVIKTSRPFPRGDAHAIGYKVLQRGDEGLSTYGGIHRHLITRDWEYSLTPERWSRSYDYPCGFHVFLTKEDAGAYRAGESSSLVSYEVVKVECRGILAMGLQDGCFLEDAPAFVCREIRLAE